MVSFEFLGICLIELLEVFFGLLLDIAEMPVDLALAEVVFLAVGGPELGAVDSDCFSANKTRFFEEQHIELEAVFECFGIVFAEVGNGVVVGYQPTEQPSDFDVAPAFPFEFSAAPDAVEVSIEIEFEKDLAIIGWPSFHVWSVFRSGFSLDKSQELQFELVDKGIDDPDGIIFTDLFIKA